MGLGWGPTPEELADFEAAPWTGFTGRLVRPFDFTSMVRIWLTAMALYTLAAVGFLALAGFAVDLGPSARVVVALIGGLSLLTAGIWALMVAFLPPLTLRRTWGFNSAFAFVGGGFLTTAVLVATGRTNDIAVLAYCLSPVFALYMLRPWAARVVLLLNPVLYGAVLVGQGAGLVGFGDWVMLTAVTAGLGLLVGGISSRSEQLRVSEQRARRELAEFNTTLEGRVEAQVAELEHLGRLRRFLAPRVADAIASSDHEKALAPHRRRIAVLFCDLRGFTSFTNSNEPEEVLAVLEEYFATIGEIFDNHDVTVGQYTGDGVMAFVGDPLPVDDPAGIAAATAVDLRTAMARLTADWRSRGHDIGFGCSVTLGYATLGVIGTGAKRDYTPMGTVVNLAARLCAQAADGQILTDQATHLALEGQIPSRRLGAFDLKGFGTETTVYAIDQP